MLTRQCFSRDDIATEHNERESFERVIAMNVMIGSLKRPVLASTSLGPGQSAMAL